MIEKGPNWRASCTTAWSLRPLIRGSGDVVAHFSPPRKSRFRATETAVRRDSVRWRRWTQKRDAMDHDTIALTKLKEEMRLRQRRHAAGPRPANEVMTPQIKMIVSNWYTDELGNQARFIKARD